MPDIRAGIDYLARLDLYKREKPYLYLLGENDEVGDDIPLTNLEFTTQPDVQIQDMRDKSGLKFSECGFEFQGHHESAVASFDTLDDINLYTLETETLLMQRFKALKVLTYEVKLRKNLQFERESYDVNDKLVIEGPAKGAHADVTIGSGKKIIQKYLSEKDQTEFLRPENRVRIVNTWRPLNAVLEDRPLALCDSRTILNDDLAPSDRVLPDRETELYYIHYGSHQKWYWLERQRRTEPFIFLMYDTLGGENKARFCPHVSFHNPRASPDAQIRSSVETRSIVITNIAADRVNGS